MATSNVNIQYTQSTDAEFRNWGSNVALMLQNCGLVQTSDTGQINWTTVTRVGASTAAGYEIYRFNDSLQATKPVFLKVEYGSGTAGNTQPQMWVTASTSTNGAGTLSGISTSRVLSYATNSPAAVATPFWASGDTSSIGLITTSSASLGAAWSWNGGFWVERSRDADGTPNGDGVYIWAITSTSQSVTTCLSTTISATGSSVTNLSIPVSARYNGSSFQAGNTGDTVFPAVVTTPKPQGPSLLLLGCGYQDFARSQTYSIVINGTAHTYLAITGTVLGASSMSSTSVGLLMRYE